MKAVRYFSALAQQFAREKPLFPEALRYERPTKLGVMKNGIRIISESWKSDLSTIGIMIDAGSRNEGRKAGTANLAGNLLLYGTKGKDANSLRKSFEDLGANIEINVKRDNTWIEINVMTQYVEEVIKLLGEMLSESNFTENSVSEAKKLAMEDCENSMSIPSYTLHENIHRTSFKDNAFGNFVKGNSKTIRDITRSEIVDFATNLYVGQNMIISTAGGIDHETISILAEKYFWRLEKGQKVEVEPPNYSPSCIQCRTDEEITYLAIAYPGPSIRQNQFIAFQLLEQLMSNPINLPYLDYPKQYNYLHSMLGQIGGLISHHCVLTNYSDCGLFIHFLECEPISAPFLGSAVVKSMLQATKEISNEELTRAKSTFLNKLLLLEGSSQVAQLNANQLRLLGARRSRADVASSVVQYEADKLTKVYAPWITSSFPVVGIYGKMISENIAEIIYKDCGGGKEKK